MSKPGIFTISIDTELAWGTFDHGGYIKYREAYEKYRFIIANILELFKKYEIAATWAVVGHLFLDSCKKEDGKLHPDIVRPKHSWFASDWFSYDPGTDISRDNFWYGSDIVKIIKDAQPEQEIACHSFCHPVFSDGGCSKETAESDIAKCVALAKKEGIVLASFTFPRNSPGHLDVVSKYGFKVFRGKDALFYNLRHTVLRKALLLFTDMLPITPPVVSPNFVLNDRLLEVKGSMLFRFAHGASRFIPKGVRLKKAKKGIDKAIKERKVFHMWLHPISFAWKTSEMLNEFEGILKYASNRREEGNLKILTLWEIADNWFNEVKDNDKYNPKAVALHSKRSHIFNADYSDDLSHYHSSAFKYGRKKIETALLFFLDNLSDGNRILDVGSGTGYYLNLIHKRGYDCVGVDLSEQMVRQSLATYSDIFVQIADARQLPFLNDCFDTVVSIETLRYFSNRDSFLREIFRVTKPEGKIFITAAPLLSANSYGIFNTLCRIFRLKSLVSCFQSFETVGSLRGRLEEAGFKEITIRGYFFGPYFLLDKICLKVSSFLMRRFERFDDKLANYNSIRNFSNHLIAIARKP